MTSEEFKKARKAWREQHPDPREDYLRSIPKHVPDSLALESDHVSLEFLEKNLGSR